MRFKSVLSEILQENLNLLEAKEDRRETIQRVLGFSQEWAEEFYSVNNKMCMWIADTFLKEMIKKKEREYRDTNIKNFVVNFLNHAGPRSGIWVSRDNGYLPKYEYIFDWFINVNTGGNINLKALSFEQALNASEQWHDSRDSKKDSNYQEANEVVIDYRENGVGFYWANLNVSYSKEEGDRMGHCGNKHGTTLFSLRSINQNGEGESFVTLARQNDDGLVSEIHGKKNSKPKSVYYRYIIDFLLNNKYHVNGLTLKGVYKPEHNFNLNDLSPEQLEYVFNNNRDIKAFYVLGEDTKIIAKNIENNDLCLAEKNKKYYGIVNLETIEMVKPFEYKIASHSEYTDFFSIGSEVYITKEFESENGDKFFTKQFWYNKDKTAHTKLYSGGLPKNHYFSFTSEDEISKLEALEDEENKKGEN